MYQSKIGWKIPHRQNCRKYINTSQISKNRRKPQLKQPKKVQRTETEQKQTIERAKQTIFIQRDNEEERDKRDTKQKEKEKESEIKQSKRNEN